MPPVPPPANTWSPRNIGFTALLILGLCALAWFGFSESPIPVELGRVDIGSIEQSIEDDGETRIRERYTITSPITGKLARIELHPGDPIEKDRTRLALLEPADPSLLDARERLQGEGRLRASQAAIERADELIKVANESLELADHNYSRGKKLLATNAIAQAEFDQIEHSFRSANAGLRAANFFRSIAQHEYSVAEAALAIDTQQPNTPFEIKSPINGTVLRVLREDAGVITPGSPLLEVGDPREMEVQIDVLSTAAVSIRPNNKVWIERWGSDQALSGRVRRIEPAAFLKVSALGVEEKRVHVLVDLDQPWEERQTLGDGYRIEARIVIDSSPAEGMFVPTGALVSNAQSWFVYRYRSNSFGYPSVERVEVSVGIKNRDFAQITSGLNKGDSVVLYPPEKLKDGSRVSVYVPNAPTP